MATSLSLFFEKFFIIKIVTIKFKDPKIDEIPVIWIEKIVKSTEGNKWYKYDDNGGSFYLFSIIAHIIRIQTY